MARIRTNSVNPADPALRAAYGPHGYLLASFRGNDTNQEVLHLTWSPDGATFIDSPANPVFSGVSGSVVRDPSIIWWGGAFYVAHTRTPSTGTSYDVIRSTDLLSWQLVATVDVSSIGGSTQCWAPELITDGTDVYCFFTINGAEPWWQKATNAGLSAWTAPQHLVITGRPASVIDPTFVLSGGTYYCFYKDETNKVIGRATSTTPTGTYTTDRTGDWAGWGTGVEGPSLVQLPNGSWRIYMDRYVAGTGIAYSDSADLNTWTALTGAATRPALAAGDELRHGTVLPIRDPAADAAVRGLLAAPRHVVFFSGHALGSQTVSVGTSFTVLPITIVDTDTAGGWNSAAGTYTVPETGTYHIEATVRVIDGTPAGIGVGMGVDKQVGDFPGFSWHGTTGPTGGRASWNYSRDDSFAAGDVLSLFAFADGGPATYVERSLTVRRVF